MIVEMASRDSRTRMEMMSIFLRVNDLEKRMITPAVLAWVHV